MDNQSFGDEFDIHEVLPDAMPPSTALLDFEIKLENLPETAKLTQALLASGSDFFSRGDMSVIVRRSPESGGFYCKAANCQIIIAAVHDLVRPVTKDRNGKLKAITYPLSAARLVEILDPARYRSLRGFSSSPILRASGEIIAVEGYDAISQLYCYGIPQVNVSAHPRRAQANAALHVLRDFLKTFPFAGAKTTAADGHTVNDLDLPPGEGESCALVALLTAILRPSLPAAPGILIGAPAITGSGAGKGLFARVISAIAYGEKPSPFTAGHNREELEKRLSAALQAGGQIIFLDNLNGVTLRSDTLASAITEQPARVRVLGRSEMVPLNCSCLVIITGNGLTVSEDLARRIIRCDLEPQCEDAEARSFERNILDDAFARRAELLSAALTIWRWGIENSLPRGLPLGGFETWAQWCRDPLVALGCADPVAKLRENKQNDPRRRELAELFEKWLLHHGTSPMCAADLDEDVTQLLDPQSRGRQYIVSKLARLAGSRACGMVMSRQPKETKWGTDEYALEHASIGAEPPNDSQSKPEDSARKPAGGLRYWREHDGKGGWRYTP